MTTPSLDFDQIARAVLGNDDPELLGDLLEGLRQVWNARGAADLQAVDDSDIDEYANRDASRAIKALDR